MTIGCIICGNALQNLDEGGNQPSRGVEFTTYGHYGSQIFDPMDGTGLAINICDPCLSAAKADGQVLRVDPPTPQPRARQRYSPWR